MRQQQSNYTHAPITSGERKTTEAKNVSTININQILESSKRTLFSGVRTRTIPLQTCPRVRCILFALSFWDLGKGARQQPLLPWRRVISSRLWQLLITHRLTHVQLLLHLVLCDSIHEKHRSQGFRHLYCTWWLVNDSEWWLIKYERSLNTKLDVLYTF